MWDRNERDAGEFNKSGNAQYKEEKSKTHETELIQNITVNIKYNFKYGVYGKAT